MNAKYKLILLFVCMIVFAGFVRGGEGAYILTKDGESKSQIILRKEASLPEQHAAEELQAYLKKISGAEIPIVETPTEGYPIYVGVTDSLKGEEAADLRTKAEKLSNQGFIVQAGKQGLIISGRKPIGVLYGVYTFLEDTLGVHWMMPGESGEYCPHEKNISIKDALTIQNPAFTTRALGLSCTNISAWLKDTWDWMVRNKMQITSHNPPFFKDPIQSKWFAKRGAKFAGGGHVLASFVPEEEYFKDHPEYFTLINGKRIPGDHGADEDGNVYQRCTSNPEVIELGAKYIKDFFGGTPPGDTFLIGNNDGDGWCECDACRALDDPEEAKDHRVTTRFFRYINAVAEKAWEAFPENEISAWGYQQFRKPPLGVAPDPRLQVFVAMHGRCYRHALDDENCPSSAEMRKILADWAKFENTFGVREYYSCFIGSNIFISDITLPYLPLEDIVARDIKYLAKIGGTIWEDETPPPDGEFGPLWDKPAIKKSWEARFPMYYVAAKLLWNPERDIEKVKDEVYRAWYGAAFEEMKAYRQLLAKSWSEAGHFIYATKPALIGKSLEQPGREQELMGLLDAALAKVAGDEKRSERIASEKRHFQEIWVEMAKKFAALLLGNDIAAGTRKDAITVDGNLNEPDWAAAPVTTGFRVDEERLAEAQTFVKILHDDKSVWFGVELLEPEIKALQTSASSRDDAVWAGDSLEIFLDPEKSGTDYFHLAIDPKGVIYDAKCMEGGAMDKTFDGNYEVATRILDDRWVVELRIPAETLNASIVPGGSWKVNVARSRRGGKNEGSTWADGSFHQLGSMRSVIFGENAALIRNGGFEKVEEIVTDGDRVRYGVGPWKLVNEPPVYPVGWGLHESHPGKLTLIEDDVHAGKRAVKIEDGWIFTGFNVREGSHLTASFWAKGEGEVHVMLFQYQCDDDGTPLQYLETVQLEVIPLGNEWQKYTVEHDLAMPEVNNVSLAFDVRGTLLLDDVSVEERQP